ncbi:MAG TPA: hypothetical protein VGS19_27335 [Streptosporangiaceae bacterium]|nr:hypothetical protein [Streptosporangiaceae bacterium]
MRWVSPDGTPRGLRQGEKGTRIVLWKEATVKDSDLDTGERVDRPVLLARMYYVFNADLGRVLRADRRGAAGVRSRASAGLSPPPGSGPGGV